MLVSQAVLISGEDLSHLPTLELLVVWQVEDVLNQLRHRLLTYPEEDVLSILDEEQTVSFQPLAGQIKGRWQDQTVLAECSSLEACPTDQVWLSLGKAWSLTFDGMLWSE